MYCGKKTETQIPSIEKQGASWVQRLWSCSLLSIPVHSSAQVGFRVVVVGGGVFVFTVQSKLAGYSMRSSEMKPKVRPFDCSLGAVENKTYRGCPNPGPPGPRPQVKVYLVGCGPGGPGFGHP